MSKKNYTIHAAGKTEDEAYANLNEKLGSANKLLEDSELAALAAEPKTNYVVRRGAEEVKSTLGFGDATNRMAEEFKNPDEYRIEQLYKVTPTQFKALSEEKRATAGENLNSRYAVQDITFRF